MKPSNKLILTAFSLAALTASVWAQTETAAQPAVTAADVQSLKDAIAAQQLQIQRLTEQLQGQQPHEVEVAGIPSEETNAAQPVVAPRVYGFNAIVTPVTPEAAAATSQNPDDVPQTFNSQMEGPVTIHYRGINITPGGYAEAAFIRRTHALGADLPTPFNSVPMPGASQDSMPEFFGSGRQSKVTAFVDGRFKGVDLSSYVSADFLSAGVTSNSNQTNSYTLRLRQAWAQAKFGSGWTISGGQMWSLVTENGQGLALDDDLGRTNDARPKVIDPSYNVGFVYARQFGLRATESFGDKVAFAVAIENPQATLTTHGNAANFLLGEAGASNSYNTTANYSFNPAPDLIVKAAFDPGFGHYEVFGLLDRFADRVFPCAEAYATAACGKLAAASAVDAYDASKSGGGAGVSARFHIADRAVFGVKGFAGSGVGRYAPAGLPDVSINGNGTLHIVRNVEGLSTFEVHVTKKLDWVNYAGFEYAARTASWDPLANKGAGAVVGYGAPTFNNSGCYSEVVPGSGGFTPGTLANCTADTRSVVEYTSGFWYKITDGSKGKFQVGADYAYVDRYTWHGVGGQPTGNDKMVFTSFRYYLP